MNTKQIIKDSDLVLAEVSLPATGQGIELGWADVFDKKIICLVKKGSKYSGSLKFIAKGIFEYENTDDLIKKIEGCVL